MTPHRSVWQWSSAMMPVAALAGALWLVPVASAAPTPAIGTTGGRLAVSFRETATASRAATLAPLPSPQVSFAAPLAPEPTLDARAALAQDPPRPRGGVRYSEAYVKRADLHRIASWAMLPLFGAEAVIGQSLYTASSETKKSAHLVLGGAIGGLFALNSVTGVWNLIESRRDPEKRGKRVLHSILMLAADAGFLATAMSGPESEHGRTEGSPAAHRAIAFTAISTATVGYLIMLFDPH